jgi:PKD repeat protein
VAKFVGQIGIVGNAGEFSAGGDSGSLIVTDDANKYLVGLLYAGSGTRTLANPIRPVLEHFGVVIDSGSGTGTGGGTGGDTTAPVAAFSMSCNTKGTCSFTDQSTDNVGVTSWNWNLGNGITATGRTASRTYTAAGSYAVTLTVSDAVGLTNSLTKTVNCSVRGKQLRCS